ncbi:MAG: hypothetical protein AAF266_08835 [Planctomycetota bacterium]
MHLRFIAAAGIATTLVAGPIVAGKPYVPADESEVLETLPTIIFAQRDKVALLRERLSSEPGNEQLAATIAQHYVDVGKSEGDPRFFGYARAAIQRWWDEPTASASLLRVRAKLKETDHRYQAALDDLGVLLEATPGDQQALVEVANINRVLGEYAAAREASDALGDASESIPAMVASVPLLAVTGEAKEADALLAAQRERIADEVPDVLPWFHTMRAEIARSLGREADAETHYRTGLKVSPWNSYLKRSYADFLIDRDRPEEALAMLGDDLRDNGSLLRAAIAARMAGKAGLAGMWSEQLCDRFAETRLRGDLPHGRYEARYELEFGDARTALDLALANWGRQKEYRDARNVLEAAIAADAADAAPPAIAFLQQHGTQEVALDRLMRQLEAE